jgi:hypothetical protein
VTNLGADVVTLVTSENGKEAKIEIDVPELIRSVDKVKDVMLKNGDVIYVPRYPVFYIHGEVQRPGQYRLERDMTVEQALAVGGGLTTAGRSAGCSSASAPRSPARASRATAASSPGARCSRATKRCSTPGPPLSARPRPTSATGPPDRET